MTTLKYIQVYNWTLFPLTLTHMSHFKNLDLSSFLIRTVQFSVKRQDKKILKIQEEKFIRGWMEFLIFYGNGNNFLFLYSIPCKICETLPYKIRRLFLLQINNFVVKNYKTMKALKFWICFAEKFGYIIH